MHLLVFFMDRENSILRPWSSQRNLKLVTCKTCWILMIWKVERRFENSLCWVIFHMVHKNQYFQKMFLVDIMSSIVYGGYPHNFKPVYFIYEKISRAQKDITPISFARVKNCCLCSLVLAYFCFVSWFLLVTYFCACEIFS